MAEALFTPVILDKIFGKLTTPELKGIRLVCKIWADEGATHLGHRTTLSTQLIHPYQCLEEPVEISTLFNPRLGRSLKILGDGKLSALITGRVSDAVINANYSYTVGKLFHGLSSAARDYMTNIEIKNLKILGVLHLKAFSSLRFPKLTSLTFHNQPNWPGKADFILHALIMNTFAWNRVPQFLEMESLTNISYLEGCPGPWPTDTVRVCPFRPWLQACVNAAPNLQRLTLVDNFYPDLTSCGSTLKTLEYDGWQSKLIDCGDFTDSRVAKDETFDLNQLARMVAQVSESIETLGFGTSTYDVKKGSWNTRFVGYKIKPFSPPSLTFPKLTRLEFASSEYFGLFTNTFSDLTKAAPSLKHISLGAVEQLVYNMAGECEYELDSSFEPALQAMAQSGPHPGIESLSLILHKNYKPKMINGLKLGSVFPALKYLDVTIDSPNWISIEAGPELWEKIDCFNDCRSLTQLTFTVKLSLLERFSVENLVNSIHCIAKIPAQKKFVTLRGDVFPEISGNVEADTALLLARDFTSLTIGPFMFNNADLETVFWKEAYQLPITFEKCTCERWGPDWVSWIQHPIDGVTLD